MIESLGLIQWVNFPIYTKSNILVLVLTEAVCDFNITSVNQGQFLPDNCLVITYLDYPKLKRLTESISNRKWRDIEIGHFMAILHIEELQSVDCNLDDPLEIMEKYVH